jgi:inhibitor of KinA
MYGFAPGYAYLSGLPPPLHLDRKPAPVRNVPAGTVIIAGGMCLITTLTMPTGWWRIGRTETRVLTGDPAHPFAFAVGDRLRFTAP